MIKNKKYGFSDSEEAFFLGFIVAIILMFFLANTNENKGKELAIETLKVVSDPSYKPSFYKNRLLNLNENNIVYNGKKIDLQLKKIPNEESDNDDFENCVSFFDELSSLSIIQSVNIDNQNNTDILNGSSKEKCNFLVNESILKVSTLFSPELFKKTTYTDPYEQDFDNIRIIVNQSTEHDHNIPVSKIVNFQQYGDQYIGSFFLLDKKYETESNHNNVTYVKMKIHNLPINLYDTKNSVDKNKRKISDNCSAFMKKSDKYGVMIFSNDENISELGRSKICDIFEKEETLTLKIER